jgi:hypothetical protein
VTRFQLTVDRQTALQNVENNRLAVYGQRLRSRAKHDYLRQGKNSSCIHDRSRCGQRNWRHVSDVPKGRADKRHRELEQRLQPPLQHVNSNVLEIVKHIGVTAEIDGLCVQKFREQFTETAVQIIAEQSCVYTNLQVLPTPLVGERTLPTVNSDIVYNPLRHGNNRRHGSTQAESA